MYDTKPVDCKQAIEDTPMPELVDEVINRLDNSNGLEFCTIEQINYLLKMLYEMKDDIGVAFS